MNYGLTEKVLMQMSGIGGKEIVKEYEDCELAIIMCLLEGEYSFIKIFPVWKDEERITPSIKIPYLSWNKGLLMSEFIEPFLVALSQFLTEEERGKLPPPWSEKEEEEKKKGKRKRKKDDQSDDGRISVRFFRVMGIVVKVISRFNSIIYKH